MNPITIGLSDVKNVKLAKVEAYQVGDYWYLWLVYEYENTNGDKFKLEIPKMELPLKPDRLPDIVHVFDYDIRVAIQTAQIDTLNCVSLFPGIMTDTDGSDLSEKSIYAIQRISRQMTIEDIEKELGYKVNIVEEKNDDKN